MSEHRTTSCRNTGRHHLGMPGRLHRNPHQARSASLCPSNSPEMGDHARCARVCWRRPKSHRFAGVIVEALGRNLAGGQHPTHLCHHATRFLYTKAGTYELFRTTGLVQKMTLHEQLTMDVSKKCSALCLVEREGPNCTLNPLCLTCPGPQWLGPFPSMAAMNKSLA